MPWAPLVLVEKNAFFQELTSAGGKFDAIASNIAVFPVAAASINGVRSLSSADISTVAACRWTKIREIV